MCAMNIQEYFDSGKRSYAKPLSQAKAYSDTIADFYEDFISPHAEELFKNHGSTVIKFCEMMSNYAKDNLPIFWIRRFESGGSNVNDNRRTGKVLLVDNNKVPVANYAYISNFDAQEIYNMILQDVDFSDFESLMKNGEYRFHYSNGKSCAESQIAGYELLKDAKNLGIFNKASLYLAHIHDANGRLESKLTYSFPKDPIGSWKEKSDWGGYSNFGSFNSDMNTNHKLRIEEYTGNQSALKEYLTACFYRMVSPFNYFLVLGLNYEVNSYYGKVGKSIGEYHDLIQYVKCRIYEDYIERDPDLSKWYDDFENSILIARDQTARELLPTYKTFGKTQINISYGQTVGAVGQILEKLEKKILNTKDLPGIYKKYDAELHQICFTDKTGIKKTMSHRSISDYCDFLKKISADIGKLEEQTISLSSKSGKTPATSSSYLTSTKKGASKGIVSSAKRPIKEIEDYKEYVLKSLTPNSANMYVTAINRIIRQENISIETLENDIDNYITEYGPNGAKRDKNSHGNFIAALKKYKQFMKER